MLTAQELAQWLRDRRLTDGPESVITVRRAPGSAGPSASLVVRADGSAMFVKQARDRHGKQLLAREAWFYGLRTGQGTSGCDLDPYLERLLAWDADAFVLVLTADRTATDLERDMTVARYSAAVGTSLGAALAAVHRLPPPDDAGGACTALGPPGRPWQIVSTSRTSPAASPYGEPASAFLDEVRGLDEVEAVVGEIASTWKPRALVHGDVRWDNWLRVQPSGGAPGLRLVDWETACIGDPRWDVGSALAAYLWSWVRSMPWTSGMDPATAAQHARQPISIMQPGIEALCRSYQSGVGEPVDARGLVAGCITFVAARLILCAVDEVIAADGANATAAALVQLACNMIKDRAAATSLLVGPARA